MSTLRTRLTALVSDFVDRVERLIREETREEALAVLAEALALTGGAPVPRLAVRVVARPRPEAQPASRPAARPASPAAGRRPKPSGAPKPAVKPARAPVRASRGKTGRRSNVRMQRDLAALVAYVRDNPGVRMEEIAAAVGSTSKRLAVPMRRLLSLGALMRAGSNRGARYWVRDLSVLDREASAPDDATSEGTTDTSTQSEGGSTTAGLDNETDTPVLPERN